MKEETLERRLDLQVEAGELYDWHARPGAFERLCPPWEDVRMEGPAAELVRGRRQVMSLPLVPLPLPPALTRWPRVRWRAEIADVTAGESFRDVQVSGPFAKWEHTHGMSPAGEGRSTLLDRVQYALPLGALGSAVAGGYVRKKLERMFTYRHALTADDLTRHADFADRPRLDVLISGVSGLVGSALSSFLTTGGHNVRRLVRGAPRGPNEFRWNPLTGDFDPRAAEGADAVVHLAGENIAGGRWTPNRKDRIRRSRFEGTRQIGDMVRAAKQKPRVFISASAIGFYGNRGDEQLDEASAPGTGFLADVCQGWEERVQQLSGPRKVMLRFGAILSPAGGALQKMLLPFLLGGGGRLGSGKQWMSWIALDDIVGAIHHALFTETLEGPVNTVAPSAVTNADFTRTLGRVLKRPTIAPMPAFVAKAIFGELAEELLLSGQHVLPKRLEASGYRFRYPDLEAALRHQLGRA